MADNWQEEVLQLVQQCRIGFLATQGKHSPETSMAPFAMYQGNILLHLSSLARHSKNILNQPNVGFMICTPETEHQSPLALPRLSLQGKIEPVPDELLKTSKAAYIERTPDAEQLFSFADFKLFCIVPSHLQWVGGFGSARKIPVNSWYKFSQGEVD
ncbi:MAG: pyridoxamine 5'-phosphate oxidase family protein [Mariprofundaceae bacterium]|nr:pyridoxamine 5'-phosphate oxidase family protein [Mariprofundaceae bacterium]